MLRLGLRHSRGPVPGGNGTLKMRPVPASHFRHTLAIAVLHFVTSSIRRSSIEWRSKANRPQNRVLLKVYQVGNFDRMSHALTGPVLTGAETIR